jgi:hypothetical protein
MQKKLNNRKLVVNFEPVPSIVIREMLEKAMESPKRREQVHLRHYLVVMSLHAKPNL